MHDVEASNYYSNEAATFGDRIAAAREARRISQKSLAKRLGVGLKTIESWENDVSEPRANKLQTLSGILNVSIPWLLTGDGTGIAPDVTDFAPADAAELIAEMRSLRADMLRAADRLAIVEKRIAGLVSPVAEAAE